MTTQGWGGVEEHLEAGRDREEEFHSLEGKKGQRPEENQACLCVCKSKEWRA